MEQHSPMATAGECNVDAGFELPPLPLRKQLDGSGLDRLEQGERQARAITTPKRTIPFFAENVGNVGDDGRSKQSCSDERGFRGLIRLVERATISENALIAIRALGELKRQRDLRLDLRGIKYLVER